MGKVLKGVAIAAAFVALAYATGGLSVVAAGTAGAATVAGVTFTTTFLGGMLVSMAAASILTGISQQFLGAKMPKTQLSRLNVSLDPSTPRKVVFGTTAMPLDLRYHESSGTDQEYIDYIVAVAAHKVTSIDEIWFEEKQAWTAAGGVTGTYAGYLTVTTRTEGSAANYISINGGTKWGSSRRLTGCAYLHIRIKRTGNTKKAESPLVNGLPSRVTVIGNGALLYDPRKDSTVPGGSGTHRATDQSTWGAYTNADDTDNPALQLLWWMLGWEINGKLSVGCGIPYNRIDMASFITAANICDENVTLAIGGTQKRYRTSGTASDGDDRSDIINNFLISMNGTLRDNGGKLTLVAMKNDLASYVLTFSENDIYGGFDWQQTRGLTENYNIIRGRYVDPSPNSLYQMVDYPEIGFAASDGIERVMSVDLPYVEDGRRAQRLAKQILQRNQYRGMFSTTFNAKALGCQVGDVVRLNLETLGWVNKPFRVVSQEIRFDGQVPMALIEENAAIYAWDAEDVAPITPTAPTIYNPLNNPFILGLADVEAVADGKIDSFYQATMPTGTIGDIWFDTDDGNKQYRHNGTTFVVVQDTAIGTAITAAAGAQATADGKVTTFYVETTPTAIAVGDLWYKPSTKYLSRWNGTAWVGVATVGAQAGTNLFDSTGATLADAAIITSQGTAALIANQAATATSSDFSVITGATKPANNATVGAVAGTNLKDSGGTVLSDAAIKNSQQLWAEVSGTGRPADNATVGAVAGTNLKDSGGTVLSDGNVRNSDMRVAVDTAGTGGRARARIFRDGGTTLVNEVELPSVVQNKDQAWADVSGTGRPQDNATVGAAWGSNLTGRPVELTDGRIDTGLDTAGRNKVGINAGSNITVANEALLEGINGTQLHPNPEFQAGSVSGWGVYNNAGGSRVSLAVASESGIPNGTDYRLAVTVDAASVENSDPTPGWGGVHCSLTDAGVGAHSRPNKYARGTFIYHKIRAKIPVGRTINWASNSTGNEGYTEFLTTQDGTGDWKLYVMRQYIGRTGTFSSTGFFYIAGGASGGFTWYIAKWDQIDLTGSPVMFLGSGGLYDSGGAALVDGNVRNEDLRIVDDASGTGGRGRLTIRRNAGGVDIQTIELNAALQNKDQAWADVGGTGKPENNATVGAVAGTNLKRSSGVVVSDSQVLNESQLWSEVSGTGRPEDNATVGATANVNLRKESGSLVADPDFLNNRLDSNVLIIPNPVGGTVGGFPANTYGHIKIKFPSGISGDTMVKFTVDVFDYGSEYSVKYEIAGYPYNLAATPLWANCSAQGIGKAFAIKPVHFGIDSDNRPAIWIGQTDSVWQYPAVKISNFQGSYANYTEAQWKSGWSVVINQTARNATSTTIAKPTAGDAMVGINTRDENGNLLSDVNLRNEAQRFDYIVQGYGKPSDNATSDIRLVGTGTGILITGNRVTRPTGGGDWTAQAYTPDGYVGGAYCSFSFETNAYVMAGLNTDPTSDASYVSLDFCWYCPADSTISHIYESASGSLLNAGAHTATTVFSIVYDNEYVRYLKDGIEVRAVYVGAGKKYHFDSSIVQSPGITNIRFGPYAAANAPLSFINTTGHTSEGNTVFKRSNATNDWDGKSISREISQGTAFVTGKMDTVDTFIGLHEVGNSSLTYPAFAFSFHRSSNGTWAIYEDGGSPLNLGTGYDNNTQWSIRYDGVNVRYYAGTTLLRTVASAADRSFQAGVSIYSQNSRVSAIQFGPYTDRAWANIAGSGRPADNANNTYVDANGAIQGISTNAGTVVKNTLIQIDASGNFVNAGATGSGTSVSNSLVANRLVSRGSVAAVIEGNTIYRSSGDSDYNSFVSGEAVVGSCFVECIIPTSSSWTMLAFDTAAATGYYGDQDFVVHANPASGINVYRNGSYLGSPTTPSAGQLLRIVYDGINYRIFLDGTQVGTNYAAPTGQRFFPIMNAYNGSIRYAGLNYGSYGNQAFVDGSGTLQNVASGAGTVVDNTYASTPNNLIPNSDQTSAMTMAQGYNPNGATFDATLQYASNVGGWVGSYILSGTTTRNLYVHQNNITAGGDDAIALDIYPTGSFSNRIPVVAGARYIMSCYAQGHRCGGSVGLYFYNQAGVSVGDFASTAQALPYSGAASLSEYARLFVAATAPAGAASAAIYVRKHNTQAGNTESYFWLAAPQLERSNAAGPSPYVPGPATDTRQLGFSGELNADYTLTAQITTQAPDDVIINADYLGAIIAGQFNKITTPIVTKAGVSVRTDNRATYTATNITGGLTGYVTMNNTTGSADKGRATITNCTSSGSYNHNIFWDGVLIVSYLVKFTVVAADPPLGGGGSGGTGNKSGSFDSTGFTVSSTSFAVVGTITNLTKASGETIRCSFPSAEYQVNATTTVSRSIVAKWQYSPTGANSWTDVGSAVTGSASSWDAGDLSGLPGSITVNQNVAPSDAAYDLRLVAAMNTSGNSITFQFGTASVLIGV